MDTAQLVSAVYTDIQSDFQALAPRKAAMIVTDRRAGADEYGAGRHAGQ